MRPSNNDVFKLNNTLVGRNYLQQGCSILNKISLYYTTT